MLAEPHPDPSESAAGVVERTIHDDWARIVAGVGRAAAGDFQLAEDAVQDATVAALQTWQQDGVPANPAAWLVTTGKHKALDRLRRSQTLARKLVDLRREVEIEAEGASGQDTTTDDSWPDDRLRLIFTCCHPALSLESQVGVTLRLIGGLTTGEIARGFLVPEPAMAKRLTRAKAKIRDAGVPYKIPETADLPVRISGVLRVLYLIFNEGYSSTASSLVRLDLCNEAIRLARLLAVLLPDEPESSGLLALMLFNHSRHAARTDASGDLMVLDEQDRSLWDRNLIEEGSRILSSMAPDQHGPYQLQAAIAALHAEASSPEAVNWRKIAELYAELSRSFSTPIVELNRASAIGMAFGPEAGLKEIDAIEGSDRLERYHYLHAARADFLRRAGRRGEAIQAYEKALAACANPVESRYLERRLREVMATADPEGDSN